MAKMYLGADAHGRSDRDRIAWSILDFGNPDILPLPADALDGGREFACPTGVVGLQRAKLSVCLGVITVDIIAHHAMRVDKMTQGIHAVLHALHPLAGNSINAAIIKGRNYIPLQQSVKSLRFDLVLVAWVGIKLALSDGPTHFLGVVGIIPDFIPPAVGDTDVQHGVCDSFHST